MSITDAQMAGAVGGEQPVATATTERVAAARALLPRIQAGVDAGAQAREIAEAARVAGDGVGECAALYSAMASSALRADSDGSRWAAERIAKRGSELGLPSWESVARQYLARLQFADGQDDLALTQLATAELLVDDVVPDVGLVVALNGIAVAYSRIGLHEDS